MTISRSRRTSRWVASGSPGTGTARSPLPAEVPAPLTGRLLLSKALFQSLERLQKEKADKEELVLEIQVKADRAALAGKVSCAQFDAAVEQLNKMIEDTLSKVTGQEQGWHHVQQKLVEELGSKLDRLELAPLRQQLEERCRSILRQLQAQAPQAEADDAAGIRKQLLAHFHCVSCDRPLHMVVPGPHIVTVPPLPPLPPRLSVRPHSIFEPEQLRQHGHRECGAGCGYLRVPRRCGGQHTRPPPRQRSPQLRHLPPCTPGHLQPHAGLPVKARGGTSPGCPQGRVAPRTSCPRGPAVPWPCPASRAPPGPRSRPTAASPKEPGSPRPRGRRRTGERPQERRGAGGARLGAPPGHHTGGSGRSNKFRAVDGQRLLGAGLLWPSAPLGSPGARSLLQGRLHPCVPISVPPHSLTPQIHTSLRP
uniref:DUF4795 domain-containing protein n=1 Tax=Cairina moschata TaxID=8855 RepID=A0A8C3CV96_CAIMO